MNPLKDDILEVVLLSRLSEVEKTRKRQEEIHIVLDWKGSYYTTYLTSVVQYNFQFCNWS